MLGPGRRTSAAANSRLRLNSGEAFSMISAGTPRMPLGKAVAEIPSLLGRAPVPPDEKKT
jgi:hypothetical protein